MSDPTAPAGDPAAQPATSAPAPAVEAPAPATAPAPAPTTLLTDAADAPATAPAPEADPTAKPEEGKEPEKKPEAPEGAPEEYGDFELPEGSKLDDEFVTAFKPLAKELDLPQGKANKLAQMAAAEGQRLQTKFVTDLQGMVDRNAQEWADAVKADPELGGEKHGEVMAHAAKALNQFGSPALKQFLNESRLGNNPELIRLLFKAGKAISQDPAVPGRAAVATKADHEVFYGTKA